MKMTIETLENLHNEAVATLKDLIKNQPETLRKFLTDRKNAKDITDVSFRGLDAGYKLFAIYLDARHLAGMEEQPEYICQLALMNTLNINQIIGYVKEDNMRSNTLKLYAILNGAVLNEWEFVGREELINKFEELDTRTVLRDMIIDFLNGKEKE